jgi:hypothetical protein
MLLGMGGGHPLDVDAALAAVQRLLDDLTARGQHEVAYDIARAQFAASVRASFPANLSAVATALERALANAALGIPEEQREELRRVADALRSVPHP